MNNQPAIRVPQIIALYWVIKIASTTLGETGADLFSMTLNIGYGATTVIFLIGFSVLLAAKLSLAKYEPLLYWLTFTASAIVGTAISDFIDRTLGMGYALGSICLITLLLVVLALWYWKERELSVENIRSAAAESYYWAAFLVANTLGTAAGDFLADDLGAGFLQGASLIAVILVGVTLLHYTTKISKVLLFWVAFVLTRPFGATFGDLLTKPLSQGGLNLGTICASAIFAAALGIALLFELRRMRRDGSPA